MAKFDFGKVTAGDFSPSVFPKGRYTVEVERADTNTYHNADQTVRESYWVLLRLVDNERYNNRTVLASRTVTEATMTATKGLLEHFDAALPKSSESAKTIATAVAAAFNAVKGNKAAVILAEEQVLNTRTEELEPQLVIQKLVK